jgi:acyl-coenzyme A synthetase/AMP-(fatty) acid ligase
MIVNRIYHWAAVQPAKPAIIHNNRAISYAQFAQAIDAARRHLAGRKLPIGKTAVVMIADAATLWATVFALRSLGMNTICVETPDGVEDLGLKDVGAVVATRSDVSRLQLARSRALGRAIITVPDGIWRAPAGAVPVAIDDPARPYGSHILYTSGTTGQYKKLLMDGRHEEAQVARDAHYRRLEPDSVVHMLSFGIWTGVGFKQPLSVWHVGATTVIDQTEDMLRNFFRHRPSFVSVTPAQARDLIAQTATVRRPETMPIVNLVGGFVSPQLLKLLHKAKFTDVMNNYGATECSHMLRSYVADADQLAWLVPAPDRRIEIVDEDDRPCPLGEEGRLRVALLDQDARGYLDDPATSADMFRDGWFYPGDLAVAREDGRIRILGRAGDVLNVKGQKVATAPLEHELRQLLDVENVCLFQGVDEAGLEELVIALEAGTLPATAAADLLPGTAQAFDRVRFELVERFPRTTLGMQKINRRELRRMVIPAAG